MGVCHRSPHIAAACHWHSPLPLTQCVSPLPSAQSPLGSGYTWHGDLHYQFGPLKFSRPILYRVERFWGLGT